MASSPTGMPPDNVMGTVLGVLSDLKAEVAHLSQSLHSAQDRIARLEAATYTPPASPSAESASTCSSDKSVPARDHVVTSSSVASKLMENPAKSNDNPSVPAVDTCNAAPPCDLKLHLDPISNSIAALTAQLTAIDQRLGNAPSDTAKPTLSPSPPGASSLIRRDHTHENTRSISQPLPLGARSTDPCTTNTPTGGDSRTDFRLPPRKPCLVFGQPSTPSGLRQHPLNVAASPFGMYSDEQSPFSRVSSGSAKRPAFAFGPRVPQPQFNLDS